MPSEDTEAFAHYRVLKRDNGTVWELGRGAMGVTYKAIDDNLHKIVALKVINALHVNKESSRDRFLREARAAASLDHPNVAGVYHLGQSGQNYFYAMEFIDGETVEDFIKRTGPLPWRSALPIVAQVARALQAAHEKHLVHRDIKPANIMLVSKPSEVVAVKVIDFGLAKTLLEENGSLVRTATIGFVGTPLYASPEQCNEEAPNIRSDIYSLGVTLWYMLAGEPPFIGKLGEVFARHLSAPPPWNKLPASVPEPVRALLGRMLAKESDERPHTPADLRGEVEACLRAPAPPIPIPGLVTRPLAVATKREEPPQNDDKHLRRVGEGVKGHPLGRWALVASVVAIFAMGCLWLTHKTHRVALVADSTPTALISPKSRSDQALQHNHSSSLVADPTPVATPAIVPAKSEEKNPAFVADVTPTATVKFDSLSNQALQKEIDDGDGALKLGNYESALAAYQRALALDADSIGAKRGLEKIRVYAAGEADEGTRLIAQNAVLALPHSRNAAALGNSEGQATLGYLYSNGLGGLKANTIKAAELYQKAAAQGNAFAQNELGLMYQDGKGELKRDAAMAAELYQKAAAQGDAWAEANLGESYRKGEGGLKADAAKAVQLYQQSAAQGNALGQACLGFMYAGGQGGLPTDTAKAVELFELSAAQGDPIGQAFLGDMYENGKGVSSDRQKAAELYHKAASQGNGFAKTRLEALGERVP